MRAVPEIEETNLADLVRRGRPHPLLDQIPMRLRPWLLPVSWNDGRLWSITEPVERVAVAHLRWHYDLPWWRGETGPFQVTPAAFLAQPDRFRWHGSRVEAADLRFPLHGCRRRGRVQLLDGIHRLVRADMDRWDQLPVVMLAIEDLERIVNLDR